MIKNMTVKQHLEMSEKQWGIVLDKGVNKHAALDLLGITETPIHSCYLCEVFKRDNNLTIVNIAPEDQNCGQCPLSIGGLYCQCEQDDEPYLEYDTTLDEEGEINKRAVEEILELIKEGKQRLNY